jgi:predicted SprT family Zn-dependent metalloprotease
MPKKEAPLIYLKKFIPEESAQLALDYISQFKVHLTITRQRKTVLGDYRHAVHGKNHRISVNGSLNKYAFLITLIHEVAHLVTFIEYGNQVASHGKEWKLLYRKILEDFLNKNIFPEDVLAALKKSLHNLPASSCADEPLMRVLRKYDTHNDHLLFVEQISEGGLFKMDDGTVFRKGKKLRKRFQCTEISTGKLYLFSAIYEVHPVMD